MLLQRSTMAACRPLSRWVIVRSSCTTGFAKLGQVWSVGGWMVGSPEHEANSECSWIFRSPVAGSTLCVIDSFGKPGLLRRIPPPTEYADAAMYALAPSTLTDVRLVGPFEMLANKAAFDHQIGLDFPSVSGSNR